MRYGYLRDPLFIACAAAYFINRWVVKPSTSIQFFHSYLNDLICIPFWVPILLTFMRRIGFRKDDEPPRSYEILVPLIIWSFVFEIVLPHVGPFRDIAVTDDLDVLCYAGGAFIAAIFWKWWYPERLDKDSQPEREDTTVPMATHPASTEKVATSGGTAPVPASPPATPTRSSTPPGAGGWAS